MASTATRPKPGITHPLYAPVLGCTACPLHEKCIGPVPGVGPSHARVMFIGEAPGAKEDEGDPREPFVGMAGRLLDNMLERIGLRRDEVYITNVVKCRPKGNRTPTADEAAFCGNRWLANEIQMVQPEIIVALGVPASEYVLGQPVVMEHSHGKPLRAQWDPLVLPVYHPAAALHDTARLRQVQDDFDVLGKLIQGADPASFWPVDEHPQTEYVDISSPRPDGYVIGSPSQGIAVDVETVNGKLWSVQFSVGPGRAFFLEGEKWNPGVTPPDSRFLVHNYLYDSQFVSLPRFSDTMVMAYLLGLPQSLKTLALDLCGMEMRSYSDLVQPFRRQKAIDYLEQANSSDWWSPPEIEYAAWDKDAGKVILKVRKPLRIGKKITRIITDTLDKGSDPWKRWHDIDIAEREAVEDAMGPMPDGTIADVPRDEAIQYSCRDSDAVFRIYPILRDRISEAGLDYVLSTDLGILPVVAEMMRNGMAIDTDRLRSASHSLTESLSHLAKEVHEKGGKVINPRSSAEVSELLYGTLGFTPTRKTETDLNSVKEVELKKVKHPVVKPILDYRADAKTKEFTDKLPRFAANGRVHGTVKTTRTETGRLAMADPNLMQLPVRTSRSERMVRGAFIAPEGRSLLAIDYSQIEMRVVMHLSGCESGIRLFNENRDIHTETAAEIYDKKADEITDDIRRPVKNMGFGVVYKIGPQGLYDQMIKEGVSGWDLPRCRDFIAQYYRLRPEIRAFQQETEAFARRHGYVKDMFGRRRFIPEIFVPIKKISEAGKRQAVNMPVQASAQGIIKLAMVKIWQDYYRGSNEALWLLQLHDELIWEVPHAWVRRVGADYSAAMESVVSLSVPLVANVKSGKSWGELS